MLRYLSSAFEQRTGDTDDVMREMLGERGPSRTGTARPMSTGVRGALETPLVLVDLTPSPFSRSFVLLVTERWPTEQSRRVARPTTPSALCVPSVPTPSRYRSRPSSL